MRTLAVISLGVALCLLCASGIVLLAGEKAGAAALTQFSSEEELRNYLRDHAASSGGYRESLATADSAAAPAYSGTNVQVEGVDEGDIVKTDGTIIVIAEGSVVHVIGTVPSLHNITDIEVPGSGEVNAYIQSMYLSDHHLVVVLAQWGQGSGSGAGKAADLMWYPYYYEQRTAALVYDLTEASSPHLVYSCSISGYMSATRLVGTSLYIVAEESIRPYDQFALPEVTEGNTTKSVDATSVSYDPACPEVSTVINLLRVDISSGKSGHLSILAGPSSVAYMSATSLYLTMTSYGSGTWPLNDEQAITSIYRIDAGSTEISVQAQGSVPGWPLNQFALDEKDGQLRIATTDSWSQPSNNVFVLDADLKVVGELTGIASGERIYSTRFMGDRLYMVTFRQVDPLFVIDLSTNAPVVLGELKVPGVSTYLQMVDQGLLGIGSENGSVKVSLFNVTDPSSLREVATYTVDGYSYSLAQYDHKAVLYDQRHGLLAIPVSQYSLAAEDATSWSYYEPSSEALILDIGGGVSLHGKVDGEHSTVLRSLYIDDILYVITDQAVRAVTLPGLEDADLLQYSEGRGYGAIPMAVA